MSTSPNSASSSRAGRGWGTGWHCRVPGQQAAGEEPGGSQNHQWRVTHPNAKKWPKKCTKCEKSCHSILYLTIFADKKFICKELVSLLHCVNLSFGVTRNKHITYNLRRSIYHQNKTWNEQPSQSLLGRALNTTWPCGKSRWSLEADLRHSKQEYAEPSVNRSRKASASYQGKRISLSEFTDLLHKTIGNPWS